MSSIKFDPAVYHKYAEIVELLKQWQKKYPELMKFYSIGKSYEQRDIYVVELTNTATGKAEDKPGYYVDGNFHAGEVTGCAVALYTINYYLENYITDEKVKYILDNFVVYVVPRVSVDGAELYLTTAMTLRSSTRPYPYLEPQPGLHIKDINNDGHIVQMRVRDPNGDWKVSEKDSRLMIRRQPDDIHGVFYRLYDEGEILDYDGVEVKIAPRLHGLDINRNYPTNWKPEFEQKGAGPYPISEPETRAVADFILSHKNIAGLMSYHTTGGVHLRPSAQRPDKDMSSLDVAMWKTIGEKGKEYTNYPHINTLEEFVSTPQTGIFMDWAYDVEGILSWSTELWDLNNRAGIEIKNFKDFYRNMTSKKEEENGLKILAWVDKELDGEPMVPWTEFEHPQLGLVEIGGLKNKFLRQNPPHKFLEQESHKNMMFTMVHMLALPRLEVFSVAAQKMQDDIYRVTAVISNTGYQPTSSTENAQKLKRAETVKAKLTGSNFVVLSDKEELDLGHMAGRSSKKAEWLIRVNPEAAIMVEAHTDRAGKSKMKVKL